MNTPGIWWLRRGRREPMVWPFDTEEAAEDFKLEHSLLDWRTERVDDPAKDHEPVCARCTERWPCRHVRTDRQAAMIIAAANNRCHRCGKQIGWFKITFKGAGELGEDWHYHGRLGACLNEARRLAEERQDQGALRAIQRADKDREWTRARRRRNVS